jgi:hypothetical protein
MVPGASAVPMRGLCPLVLSSSGMASETHREADMTSEEGCVTCDDGVWQDGKTVNVGGVEVGPKALGREVFGDGKAKVVLFWQVQ